MDLIAKLPMVEATIYNNSFRGGKSVGNMDPNADWSKNFACMLGFEDSLFIELLRLYLTIHCDHEVRVVYRSPCLLLRHNFIDDCLSVGWQR